MNNPSDASLSRAPKQAYLPAALSQPDEWEDECERTGKGVWVIKTDGIQVYENDGIKREGMQPSLHHSLDIHFFIGITDIIHGFRGNIDFTVCPGYHAIFHFSI